MNKMRQNRKFRSYRILGRFENPLIMEYGRGHLEYHAENGEELIIAEKLGLKNIRDLGNIISFPLKKKDIGKPCKVIDIKTRQYIN